MKKRDHETIGERFDINVNVFGYENRVFSLYALKESNEQELNVLLIKMGIITVIKFLLKTWID